MDLVPPANAAEVAAKALELRRSLPPSRRGGTMVGVARAKQLANRQSLSVSTLKRMVSFFARHEVDKQAEGFNKGESGYPSKGRIAWDLWGGDPAKRWAESMLRKLESERGVTEMIDVNVLPGSDIRRIDGKHGKIRKVSLPWVTVGWSDGTTESFLRTDDAIHEDIELKTFDKGWVSLGAIVGNPEKWVATTDGLSEALAELRALRGEQADRKSRLLGKLMEASAAAKAKLAAAKAKLKAKKGGAKSEKQSKKPKKKGKNHPNPRNPFHNYKTIGLKSPKKVKRTDKRIWVCSAGEGGQVCIAQKDVPDQGIKKGAKKVIRPWDGKAKYMANYEKGRASGKYKPGNSKETIPVVHKYY